MNSKRLSPEILEALAQGAGLIVPNAQRQAQLRAAWSETRRALGERVWRTPRIVTLAQLIEERLREQASSANTPEPLLPPGAEWAVLRERRLADGGIAEARALLSAVRTHADWQLPRSAAALGGSPEAMLLQHALRDLSTLAEREGRRPARDLLDTLEPATGRWFAVGFGTLPPAQQRALQRLGAQPLRIDAAVPAPVSIASAENDDQEIELIAAWCRTRLTRDPQCRLLVVDAQLRARRRAYERVLSQALTPGEWVTHDARRFSTVFAIEGGQPLGDFPLIAHALLTLRLLTTRLPFHEIVRWLRMPFLDGDDRFAGAVVEACLRESRSLEYSAVELADVLDREDRAPAAKALGVRLRRASAQLAGERRASPEWSPRLLAALRTAGWPGARPLRSDEQQTVMRWQSLLDEYAALGAWLQRASAPAAVDALADLAAERSFDPASVSAPITLSDSHDDPIVAFDGIWIAGLDAAQWPAAPRPDVFIPLRLQRSAGIAWASAAGQTRRAVESLAAWRASAGEVICSWARLDGEAHRTPSPLLARIPAAGVYAEAAARPLGAALRGQSFETFDDSMGIPLDLAQPVQGGVGPLTLQGECGFRAYGEFRLAARELEAPQPGLNRRDRGLLLHTALEFVWSKIEGHFSIKHSEPPEWRPMISNSVEAAVVKVFGGRIPLELLRAVEREKMRLERLIERLLSKERERAPFRVAELEARRKVSIGGGQFEFRIDRIDAIEGGGLAILDYKSGEPRRVRWSADALRDPQLIAYLFAEQGRDVQALANVSLVSDCATFVGRAARGNLLPGVRGYPSSSVPLDAIDATWRAETAGWIDALHGLAGDYLAGQAPVEPANDVCRQCKLTVLCRRLELSDDGFDAESADD